MDLIVPIVTDVTLQPLGEEASHVKSEAVVEHSQRLERRGSFGSPWSGKRAVRLVKFSHQINQ